MSEKTIRVCDDCGVDLDKVSWASICGLDICVKCQRKVAEAHYGKQAHLKDCSKCDGKGSVGSITKTSGSIGCCIDCNGSGKVPTGIPYTNSEKCEKCSGSGTIELSCGLTNKCECDEIL